MSMSADDKKRYINKQNLVKNERRKSRSDSLDYCIKQFNITIRDGPYYICVVCNRLLYRKTVAEFKSHNNYYKCDSSLFTGVASFNGNMYICSTCHRKVKRNRIPSQAVCNRLIIDDTPAELADLQKLEQILISQRIVFEKKVVMPKGKQRKIKGAICNVPVTCEQTCKMLPRAIGILTVAIFHANDGCFKIFDSHSRNARGMSDPMGSCVLLELTSVVELVQYFQELYLGTLNIEFELKGIKIKTRTDEDTSDMSVILDENKKEKSDEEEGSSGWLWCCFICLYALCFSVIKQIKFWNNETLESIISHGENEFKRRQGHEIEQDM